MAGLYESAYVRTPGIRILDNGVFVSSTYQPKTEDERKLVGALQAAYREIARLNDEIKELKEKLGE